MGGWYRGFGGWTSSRLCRGPMLLCGAALPMWVLVAIRSRITEWLGKARIERIQVMSLNFDRDCCRILSCLSSDRYMYAAGGVESVWILPAVAMGGCQGPTSSPSTPSVAHHHIL